MASGLLLGDRFALGKKIGEGSYGRVYQAYDSRSKSSVAIKVETRFAASLGQEARILRALSKGRRAQGFPQFYDFLQEGLCQLLVMDMLGESLVDALYREGGALGLKRTVLAGQQMLQRIEVLHARGFVHRDIKPDNFVFGVGTRRHHLHLIDFGLAKEFFHDRHVPARRQRQLVGTTRYASKRAHALADQSRRDDLESLGYVLVYLLKGALPWSGIKAPSPEMKCRIVGERKRATSVADLCRGCPPAFTAYFDHVFGLAYAQRPDYDLLHSLLGEMREDLSAKEGARVQDVDILRGSEASAHKGLELLGPRERVLQPDEKKVGGRRHTLLSWARRASCCKRPDKAVDQPDPREVCECPALHECLNLSASLTLSDGSGELPSADSTGVGKLCASGKSERLGADGRVAPSLATGVLGGA